MFMYIELLEHALEEVQGEMRAAFEPIVNELLEENAALKALQEENNCCGGQLKEKRCYGT